MSTEEEKDHEKNNEGILKIQPTVSLRRRKFLRYCGIAVFVGVCACQLVLWVPFLLHDMSFRGRREFTHMSASHNTSATSHPEQERFHPHEIANLVKEYYELLAQMRYFPPSFIKLPPHSPPVDVLFARELGMETQVIELLELLPYVDGYSNQDEFVLGGSFADFRNRGTLQQSRDPAHAEPEVGFNSENGEYVRPWVVVLNECGNHGSVMYLDTRSGNITLQWQAAGGSSDPYFYPSESMPTRLSKNKNSIEHLPSRDAKLLLEDFMTRLRTLEWIPFVHYGPRIITPSSEEYDDLKLLFQTYGWPKDFNGTRFDAAAEQWKEFDKVRAKALEPMEEVHRLERMKSFFEEDLRMHLARLRNGVWDHHDKMEAEEVARLDWELENKRQGLREAEEQLGKERKKLEGYVDIGVQMEKAWRTYLVGEIEFQTGNVEWLMSMGKQYADEAALKKAEAEIEVLRVRLKNVASQPKTSEEAIRLIE